MPSSALQIGSSLESTYEFITVTKNKYNHTMKYIINITKITCPGIKVRLTNVKNPELYTLIKQKRKRRECVVPS